MGHIPQGFEPLCALLHSPQLCCPRWGAFIQTLPSSRSLKFEKYSSDPSRPPCSFSLGGRMYTPANLSTSFPLRLSLCLPASTAVAVLLLLIIIAPLTAAHAIRSSMLPSLVDLPACAVSSSPSFLGHEMWRERGEDTKTRGVDGTERGIKVCWLMVLPAGSETPLSKASLPRPAA